MRNRFETTEEYEEANGGPVCECGGSAEVARLLTEMSRLHYRIGLLESFVEFHLEWTQPDTLETMKERGRLLMERLRNAE